MGNLENKQRIPEVAHNRQGSASGGAYISCLDYYEEPTYYRVVRYLLAILVGACCSGATVTATAFCSDAVTIATATSASCSGTITAASATMGAALPQGFLGAGLYSVLSQATYTFLNQPGMSSAVMQLDADLVVTLHGGVGSAQLLPCLSGAGFASGNEASGEGIGVVTIGGNSRAVDVFGSQTNGTCPGSGGPFAVAFETPTPFHLMLKARAFSDAVARNSAGTGFAAFYGFNLFNAAGQTIAGSFTIADPTAIPEPSMALPVVAALATLLYRRNLKNPGNPSSRSVC